MDQKLVTFAREKYRQGIRLIPIHMRDGVIRYLEQGIPGGSFMTAVLANDLMGAMVRADSMNQHAMGSWAEFVLHFCPAASHGSQEAIDSWCERGGLQGFETESSGEHELGGLHGEG